MFKKILSLVLNVLLVLMGFVQPQVSEAQEKTTYNIAVLDLNAQGISGPEAAFLSESLQT